MKGRRNIHIGTSGWHYSHWRGPFYPREMASSDYIGYYARHFQTVEINNSFYRLPKKETLANWRQQVPPEFIFSIKGSRYITHMKKLKAPEESLTSFLEAAEVLGEKLGPILFQLPPRWNFNARRLERFLQALPKKFRYAFEFRDRSWINAETLQMLKARDAAFCIYDFRNFLTPKHVTSDFIYIRLHGPQGAYQGRYGTGVLSGWAGAFAGWTEEGKEIFCYFDNDEAGYAIQDAGELQGMIER